MVIIGLVEILNSMKIFEFSVILDLAKILSFTEIFKFAVILDIAKILGFAEIFKFAVILGLTEVLKFTVVVRVFRSVEDWFRVHGGSRQVCGSSCWICSHPLVCRSLSYLVCVFGGFAFLRNRLRLRFWVFVSFGSLGSRLARALGQFNVIALFLGNRHDNNTI